jgi:hypothetical protein
VPRRDGHAGSGQRPGEEHEDEPDRESPQRRGTAIAVHAVSIAVHAVSMAATA